MKKAAILLLFCAMLALVGTACASVLDTIAPLYDQREEGSVFIGTVISAGEGAYVSGGIDGVTFTQPYVLTEKGMHYVSHLQQFTNGMALFTTQSEQEAAPISTQEIGGTVLLASHQAFGVQLCTGRVLYPITWRNAPCYLVESKEAVSLGAAVLDNQQALAGVIVAAWGEGVQRYVMLPVTSFMNAEGMLVQSGAETTPAPEQKAFVQWLKDFTVTLEGHLMTVTWNQEALENVQEDSVVSVFLADQGNTYYSWIYGKASDGKIVAPVVPGHTYQYAVQHTHGETLAALDWVKESQMMMAPEAAPFTQHAYADASIYLGTLPATTEGFSTAVAHKPEKLTRELLEDESLSLFLQVTSTYQVTAESSCDMLLTLTTPDGNVFCEMAGYSFLPELGKEDIWNANLDGLVDNYIKLKKQFEPGEYVVQYYFDGALVNTVRFTLE